MARIASLCLAIGLLAAPALAQSPGDAAAPVAPADLPFAVDLPEGFIVRLEPRAEFDEYRIVRDGQAWMAVYAGCCSQFPYYDGRRVDFGATSYIAMEVDGAERQVEYLTPVQGDGWRAELHVWLLLPAAQDWTLAGEIARSVRPLENRLGP